MNRALALALVALPLLACGDDMGGHPAPDDPAAPCAEGWCLDHETRAEMAARADALATCVPADDRFEPRGPGGLTVGGIRMVEVDGEPMLEAQLLNLDPRGFWGYPGLTVEVLAGTVQLRSEWSEMSTRHHHEQYYGIEGCGAYTVRLRLEPGYGALEPIRLRVAATVLHQEAPADEWVFTFAD